MSLQNREVHRLDFEVARILTLLDLVFYGRIKGWERIRSGFKMKLVEISEAVHRGYMFRVRPVGWSKEDFIDLAFSKLESGPWQSTLGRISHHGMSKPIFEFACNSQRGNDGIEEQNGIPIAFTMPHEKETAESKLMDQLQQRLREISRADRYPSQPDPLA